MSAFDELAALKTAYMNRVKADGKTILGKTFLEFFAGRPDLKAIRWQQYTPHFNDGEACEFSVGDFGFKFEDTDADAGDREDGYDDAYSLKGARKKECAAFAKQFADHDDLFKLTFGDHVQVVAADGNFEVEEYEHD